MGLNVAKHRRLYAAVREIKARTSFFGRRHLASIPAVAVLDLGWRELYRSRVAMRSQPIDDRTTWIAKPEKLRDLVECFASGIVAGMAYVLVAPTFTRLFSQVQVRVSARYDQGYHGELQLAVPLLSLLEQDGMNVSFEMVDRDQWFVEG